MSSTWLSIVTVVKDDLTGLSRTMGSLRDQGIEGVEHLIIDSSGNREAVEQIAATTHGTQYHWVEPQGIYPAMNSGLEMSRGDYCYFLNAGDSLYDDGSLGLLRRALEREPVWAFGPVEIVSRDGSSVITPGWDYATERSLGFSRGLFPPHQGTVARTASLRELGGFDASYRVAADYAMALRLALVADPELLGFVLARFTEGGTSTVRWAASVGEFHRARREILRPSGGAALRERWETATHFVRLGAYRALHRGSS